MNSISNNFDSHARPVKQSYDVFNGDADGICSLHQLRLAHPKETVLVTGVKRNIDLLRNISPDTALDVTVLDLSLDVNATPLHRILDAGAHVTYFDHHSSTLAFQHPALNFIWDGSPNICTGRLVDRYLNGQFRIWAVVAAFGDNLLSAGRVMARTLGLREAQIIALEKLGSLLNYNAYGESIDVLHIAPDSLYRALHEFADPFDFIATSPIYHQIADGFQDDAAHIKSLSPEWQSPRGAIYVLPDAPWAHRISGVLANQLASQSKDKSYAVLTEKANSSYVVSVRSTQLAANRFCEKYPSGGGRSAAAGISALPRGELSTFINEFFAYFAIDRA